MKTVFVLLDTLQKLKSFVADCSVMPVELEVAAGEHSANAKSLLGLMTLPLSGPLELRFQADSVTQKKLMKILEPYRIPSAPK